MPRVRQKRANKDYPESGIKKGDTYYTWSFRYGGTYKSLKRPRPSQLTQSKWSAVYAAQEAIEDCDRNDKDSVHDAIEQAASDVRDVASEYNDAAEAMGGAGEQNQERAGHLEELADELDRIADEVDEVEVKGWTDEVPEVEWPDVPGAGAAPKIETFENLKDYLAACEEHAKVLVLNEQQQSDLNIDIEALRTFAQGWEEPEEGQLEGLVEEALGLDWDNPC